MAVRLKDLSLEQFLALPEKKPALEYEEGRITQKVSPQEQHGRLQLGVGGLIDQFAIPRKLAMAFSELRYTFGGRSLVPDLSVFRWSRLPVNAVGKITNKTARPPDLVVEIVSPEQSARVLARRCSWLVANGIAVALLIDPEDESILSFRPNQITAPLRGSDRIDLDDILPGFILTVHDVFNLLMTE